MLKPSFGTKASGDVGLSKLQPRAFHPLQIKLLKLKDVRCSRDKVNFSGLTLCKRLLFSWLNTQPSNLSHTQGVPCLLSDARTNRVFKGTGIAVSSF